MTYQEEERARIKRQSGKRAIALAMEGRWQEAVAANKNLLESFPSDVDACNRLGRAYMELGEYLQAREAYERAIGLDPYNTIAQKNLDRLAHLGETVAGTGGGFNKVEPQHFIKEVGKAGVVNLYCLAPQEVLARIVAGSKANLLVDGSNLIIKSQHGDYLGQAPPKYGQRLIKLIEGGNEYSVAVVSSKVDAITVIIREEYQHPSQAGRLSFPPKGAESFRPYDGDRIIRREIEHEEALPGESSYTIIGGELSGEEVELLEEETDDVDDENEDEE